METDVWKIEEQFDKYFERNLRKIIEIRGLNFTQVCEMIHLNSSTLSMNYKSRKRPRFSIMLALSRVLRCSIEDLISERIPDATTLP